MTAGILQVFAENPQYLFKKKKILRVECKELDIYNGMVHYVFASERDKNDYMSMQEYNTPIIPLPQ